MTTEKLKNAVLNGALDDTFAKLYGADKTEKARERYIGVLGSFTAIYGEREDAVILSVPGRSEISGNHTDHNCGRVIAASVDCDIIAVAAKSKGTQVRVKSDGYKEDLVRLDDLSVEAYPRFKSVGLVAGMCAAFQRDGKTVGAFDAYTTSNVLKGSGLSSSAAFEVMVGTMLNHLYNDGSVAPTVIAEYAQWAENVYFGKPCGLMDQTACAVGGFVFIDFDPENRAVRKIDFDLTGMGYDLCIVNTGGSHADLNDDYAAIPKEMKEVAAFFGRSYLRGITEEDLLQNARAIREKTGDRALLRALHFVNEDARIPEIESAMRHSDLVAFLDGIRASGNSSFKYLQNVFPSSCPAEQGETLAIYTAERSLSRCPLPAVCRVHGGGFAGTMQAFVPTSYTETFRRDVDLVMGKGACMIMHVRSVGAVRVL